MATSAEICILTKDGKLKGVRCNYDGYLYHTGKILLENYNTKTLVTKLLSLGDMSALQPKMNKPVGHSFSKPVDGYTIFYGRDRGEDNVSAKKYDSVEDVFSNCNVDYVYVFWANNNSWYFCKPKGELESLTKDDVKDDVMANGGYLKLGSEKKKFFDKDYTPKFKAKMNILRNYIEQSFAYQNAYEYENFTEFMQGIHTEIKELISEGKNEDGTPMSNWLTYDEGVKFVEKDMIDELKDFYYENSQDEYAHGGEIEQLKKGDFVKLKFDGRTGVIKSYKKSIEHYLVDFGNGIEESYPEKDLTKVSKFEQRVVKTKMAKSGSMYVNGGEIIGKTKSGKKVFNTPNHSSYEKFTMQDLQDSIDLAVDKRNKAERINDKQGKKHFLDLSNNFYIKYKKIKMSEMFQDEIKKDISKVLNGKYTTLKIKYILNSLYEYGVIRNLKDAQSMTSEELYSYVPENYWSNKNLKEDEVKEVLQAIKKVSKKGGSMYVDGGKIKTNKELSDMYSQMAMNIEEEMASDKGGETSGMNYEKLAKLQKEKDKYIALSIKYDTKKKMAQGGSVAKAENFFKKLKSSKKKQKGESNLYCYEFNYQDAPYVKITNLEQINKMQDELMNLMKGHIDYKYNLLLLDKKEGFDTDSYRTQISVEDLKHYLDLTSLTKTDRDLAKKELKKIAMSAIKLSDLKKETYGYRGKSTQSYSVNTLIKMAQGGKVVENGDVQLPAGKYYVGDLCYVLHDEWDEVCDLTIKENECINGVFTLKNGTQFALYGTAYGDGGYSDTGGRLYGVDSGTLGCVLVSKIDTKNKDNDLSDGNIISFETSFTTGYMGEDEEEIYFGMVVINTGYEDDDDDNDEDDDEDFNEDDYDENDEDRTYANGGGIREGKKKRLKKIPANYQRNDLYKGETPIYDYIRMYVLNPGTHFVYPKDGDFENYVYVIEPPYNPLSKLRRTEEYAMGGEVGTETTLAFYGDKLKYIDYKNKTFKPIYFYEKLSRAKQYMEDEQKSHNKNYEHIILPYKNNRGTAYVIYRAVDKFATGGEINIGGIYKVNGKDYLFQEPMQDSTGNYTKWKAYEVAYDLILGEKHINYDKTKTARRVEFFPNNVKRDYVGGDYFAKGGGIGEYWSEINESTLNERLPYDMRDVNEDEDLISGNIWIKFKKSPLEMPNYELKRAISEDFEYFGYGNQKPAKNVSLMDGSWGSFYIDVENLTLTEIKELLLNLPEQVQERLEDKKIKGYKDLGFDTYGQTLDLRVTQSEDEEEYATGGRLQGQDWLDEIIKTPWGEGRIYEISGSGSNENAKVDVNGKTYIMNMGEIDEQDIVKYATGGGVPGLDASKQLSILEVDSLYRKEPKLDDPYYPKSLIKQVGDIAYYMVMVNEDKFLLAMDTTGNYDDKWYFTSTKSTNNMSKPKETGGADIRIELTNGNVTVLHGSSGEVLLNLQDVPTGTWDKLWDFLRNKLV